MLVKPKRGLDINAEDKSQLGYDTKYTSKATRTATDTGTAITTAATTATPATLIRLALGGAGI